MTRSLVAWGAVAVAAYAAALTLGNKMLVAPALLGAVMLFRACFRGGRHRLAPFAIVLVVLALQNVAAGGLGRGDAPASLSLAIWLSALLPAAILAGGWLSEPAQVRNWFRRGLVGEERWLVFLALAAIATVALRWLTGPTPLALAMPSVRNALTPAYGVLVVLLLPPILRPTADEFGRWLARWGVIVAVLGFVEWTLLRDRFWATIAHIGAAISVKHLSIAHVRVYRVPADFYTAIGHHYFRRLVSVYGDAVTTSYYLALALLAAVLLSRRSSRLVQVAVIAPALALGAVKGAFGIVLVGAIVIAIVASPLHRAFSSGAVVVLLACFTCVLFVNVTRVIPFASSADLHADGLRTAVQRVTSNVDASIIWGDGMGTGGSGAAYVQRNAPDLSAARAVPGLDNGAGTILVQTGVLGLVLVLGQFALLAGVCLRRARESRGALLAAAAVIALLVNFLLQEHALTLATSLPFWLLGAVAMTAPRRGVGSAPVVPRVQSVDEISEDPELLELMFDDFCRAQSEHRFADARLSYVKSLMAELDTGSAETTRVSHRSMRASAEISAIDRQVALLACYTKAAERPHLVSVDKLAVSRAGNPAGFDNGGNFLTREALVAYLHCAYMSRFVNLDDVDVLVQLGCGSGEHAETLHNLYPNLTIVLLDIPPQLYRAERFLRTAYPDDTVAYRATRAGDRLDLQRGKIHFLGESRLRALEHTSATVFWHAVDAGAPPLQSFEDYGGMVSGLAEWLYLSQAFGPRDVLSGRAPHWEAGERTLADFALADWRVGPSYFEPGARLDEAFWTRTSS